MSLDEMQARCDAATPGPLRYTPTIEGCGHIVMPKMREDAAGAYVHWPEHEKALARLELLEAALRVAMDTVADGIDTISMHQYPVGEYNVRVVDHTEAEQWRLRANHALARVTAILEGK